MAEFHFNLQMSVVGSEPSPRGFDSEADSAYMLKIDTDRREASFFFTEHSGTEHVFSLAMRRSVFTFNRTPLTAIGGNGEALFFV